MPRVVHVTAPSRLHFGLWSLGGGEARQFGGVGAMIERPELKLSVTAAEEFSAVGDSADRAIASAGRWAEFHGLPPPRCRIEISRMIPQHAGLGSGTQLGLAVAAGLNAFCGLPSQTPQELALSVGRGLRSAVGTYGFVFGGLIVEQGKLPTEPISPLDCRIDFPDLWRFVLVRPHGLSGLTGMNETDAFEALPAVPQAVTDELIAVIRDRLVPAAATLDFQSFSESLYHYGRMSGECFATRQGGPFNGPLLTQLVEQIRNLGHAGVGQTSWGPTVFVAVPSQSAAEQLAADVRSAGKTNDFDVAVSPPNNRGARIEVGDAAQSG